MRWCDCDAQVWDWEWIIFFSGAPHGNCTGLRFWMVTATLDRSFIWFCFLYAAHSLAIWLPMDEGPASEPFKFKSSTRIKVQWATRRSKLWRALGLWKKNFEKILEEFQRSFLLLSTEFYGMVILSLQKQNFDWFRWIIQHFCIYFFMYFFARYVYVKVSSSTQIIEE